MHLTACRPWPLIVLYISPGGSKCSTPEHPFTTGERNLGPPLSDIRRSTAQLLGGETEAWGQEGLAGTSAPVGDALPPRPRQRSFCLNRLHCPKDVSRCPPCGRILQNKINAPRPFYSALPWMLVKPSTLPATPGFARAGNRQACVLC